MDEDKPFTVRDRRKFTAEGDLKSDIEEGSTLSDESAPEERPPEPVPPVAPHSAGVEPGAAGSGRSGEVVDFAGFLISLATQASVLLSTPEGDAAENLREAKQLIGILEMLEDKSRGRRTPEEDQVLEQVLYELRMAFVERKRAASR